MSEALAGMSATDLVSMALRQVGIGAMGTTASPSDIEDGLRHLNMLLAQWQRKRWVVPNLVDHAFMANGQVLHRIGPGGELDLPVRPDQIEAAYARFLNGADRSGPGDFDSLDFCPDFLVPHDGLSGTAQPVDYALTQIPSCEDYSCITIKNLPSWPTAFHYNPAWPMGEFRPFPVPQAGTWEFHILIKHQLQGNLTADSHINLPPEYEDAIMWVLAARMAPSYGQEASPTVIANAKAALNTIRVANTQIPTMGTPTPLQPFAAPFWWPGLENKI